MFGILLLSFLAGLILDGLITWHYRSISSGRALLASGLSIIITLISVFVIVEFVKEKEIFPMIAYAFGNGVGTWIAMKVRRKY